MMSAKGSMPIQSYVHGSSDVPLLGETIGQCLDRMALAHPEGEALVSAHQNLRYTYGELHAEVELVARGLMALGIARGDRVGVWSANCAEWLIVQYAAAKVGAILVNVNPAYRLRRARVRAQAIGHIALDHGAAVSNHVCTWRC